MVEAESGILVKAEGPAGARVLERLVKVMDASGPARVRMRCDHNKMDCMGTLLFESVGSD